jgi:glycosyltransferase involved in cell wall biosynthesis
MRILVLCHEYPPVGGGASTVSRVLAHGYADSGHDVRVLTMGWDRLPAEETDDRGPTVRRISCLRRRREQADGATALLWAARAAALCEREQRVRPFDVVHAHFVMPAGIVASRLRRRHGVPYVLTAHGSDVPGFDPRRFRMAHRLVRPWWRRICAAAGCVVAPSRSLQDLLREAAPSLEPVRIPNPVDVSGFAAASKEQRILLCGRLVARKGFADAFGALRDVEIPGWSLDVVGDGPERARLSALASELRTPVRFHGWLERDATELRALFSRAAIFLFPSWRENFPVTVLEAMAAGCAIVATDLPGNFEAVGECARLVRAGDRRELRDAVLELAGDPARRSALGEAARSRVATEFSAGALVPRYLEILSAAAGERA